MLASYGAQPSLRIIRPVKIAHTYCGYSGSINFAELIHGRVPADGPAWTRSHGRTAAWHMRAGRER
ncbi:hypothetical protein C7S15_3945 [Burkholderia cepacia]|nr:hypothetical protein [Burkholderia cepacia]